MNATSQALRFFKDDKSSIPSTTADGVYLGKFLRTTDSVPIQIDRLVTKSLERPIVIKIEYDDGGYIAHSVELPQVYGYGDSKEEAVEALKRDIESLYNDLLEDDNFSEEWLEVKSLLQQIVAK